MEEPLSALWAVAFIALYVIVGWLRSTRIR